VSQPQLSLMIAAALICGGSQAPQQGTAATPATQTAPPAPRPTPPTRDPHTPGYVEATEIPDGMVPPPDKNGNFIIGPTHTPAPEMTVQEGVPQGTVHTFTMSSADSKIYPVSRDWETNLR
jgi:enterochelin esterase family protein